jgi:hypothetical protein
MIKERDKIKKKKKRKEEEENKKNSSYVGRTSIQRQPVQRKLVWQAMVSTMEPWSLWSHSGLSFHLFKQ